MEYMKLVSGSPHGDAWSAYLCGSVTYAAGRVTTAECRNGGRHPAPDPDCKCGIYAVRASWRGLITLACNGWHPGVWDSTIIAVQPIGRAYSDGLVVRAERVLTLGPIDWQSLVPRAVRRAPAGAEYIIVLLYLARALGWDALTLARLRHALGRGCYSADRIRRIAKVYRDRTRWTRCPYCHGA